MIYQIYILCYNHCKRRKNMKTRIVLTGILKDDNMFLTVRRNENDDLFPGEWEFPGGHLDG